MKGISLPINTVIVVVIAILVLSIVVFFFVTGTNPFIFTKYESEFNKGCEIYVRTGQDIKNIVLGDVNLNGSNDNLLTVCRLRFSNKGMSKGDCENECKRRFPYNIN
jgi:hypothetical protein